MTFTLDSRLTQDSYYLGSWSLSHLLLKNDRSYPWFILVPAREDVSELYQLTQNEQFQLMEEVNRLSVFVKEFFTPDKLNVAALGNVVPQLHIHVIGRYRQDKAWPQPIWGFAEAEPYSETEINDLLPKLKSALL